MDCVPRELWRRERRGGENRLSETKPNEGWPLVRFPFKSNGLLDWPQNLTVSGDAVPVLRAAMKRGAEEEIPDEILGPEVLRVDRVGRGRRAHGLLPVRFRELVKLVLGEELLEPGMLRRVDFLLKFRGKVQQFEN